jgi:hypothetical protein
MRTLAIKTLDGVFEYGTNDRDGGVFFRRRDGSWGQMAGNGQTPTFADAKQFRSYLRRHHGVTGRAESLNW